MMINNLFLKILIILAAISNYTNASSEPGLINIKKFFSKRLLKLNVLRFIGTKAIGRTDGSTKYIPE